MTLTFLPIEDPMPAAETNNGWRDIANAPRNRFIFLWCPEDGSRWFAKWQGSGWFGVDELGLTRYGGYDTGWKITSWFDLPEPPK